MRKPQKTTSKQVTTTYKLFGSEFGEVIRMLEDKLERKLSLQEICEIEISSDEDYFFGTLKLPPIPNPNYEEQMREYELQKKIQDARNVISETSPSKIVELENQIKNAKKDREKAIETLKESGIQENYHNLMEKS